MGTVTTGVLSAADHGKKNKRLAPELEDKAMSAKSGAGGNRSERLNRDGQGRALSRIFNKLDLDFINQFAETGIDNGPEPQKSRTISQRLERSNVAADVEEPKFSGFAGMFKAKAQGEAPAASPQVAKNALGGLFDPEPAESAELTEESPSVASDENPYIHKRTDAKSRRGLYTGVLKRPVFERPAAGEGSDKANKESPDRDAICGRKAVSDTMAIGEARPANAFKYKAPKALPAPSHSQVQFEDMSPVDNLENNSLQNNQIPNGIDPLAPEAVCGAQEARLSPQGTVSFIKPDLAQLNALADSAKQRRIESRFAEEPQEQRRLSRAEQKWARPGSSRSSAAECPIGGFLSKIKDLCAKLSGLCHRRVD